MAAPRQRVVIIGAGLAGLTAAMQLSEAGHYVQVVEANSFIGGRTSSWTERGMAMESGLHRFLGFYTALPAVLHKAGIDLDKMLCWEDEIAIRVPGLPEEVLGLAPLHKPLKTAAALFGHNDFLPPSDKLALTAMFSAGAKMYVQHPEQLDDITVLDFARQHNVSEQAIKHLLMPLTEGIFFLAIEHYSMFILMSLFMPYLKSLPKLCVGAFMGGMSEVMMQPMADFVVAHGGEIITGAPATQLIVENGRVTGVETKRRAYKADHVIVAASLHGAQQLLQGRFADHSSLQNFLRLPTMPAVTFQLELRKPSMPIDRTTFGPTTALASFAEQSRTTFQGSAGRLSIILAHPEIYLHKDDDEILRHVLRDGDRLGLELRDNVQSYRSVRLPHDFYSLAPGNEALRPAQQTDIPGLILAGDYTKQPYVATMEGAVVSGQRAAKLVTT
jgi:15-cis-phytoene desaturase